MEAPNDFCARAAAHMEQARKSAPDGPIPSNGSHFGMSPEDVQAQLEADPDFGVCERCGGDGMIEYNDGDGSVWGEDCPSEVNHLITCRACNGTGKHR